MTSIILPIHPKYIKDIENGDKKYEFRTRAPKRGVDFAFLYETVPTKAVVGMIEIGETLQGNSNFLWNKTKGLTTSTAQSLQDYFAPSDQGVAFQVKNFHRFISPLPLSAINISFAPQSFMYVNKDMYEVFQKEKCTTHNEFCIK